MCCEEYKNKRTFAKNIKKPSMFLSSLILKRKENRRNRKPSILLDAVLNSAINNIAKDKILSKLNNVTKAKSLSNINSNNAELGFKQLRKHQMDERLEMDCLSGIDDFFKELNSVKVERLPCNLNNSERFSVENSEDLVTQELVDNFIENGLVLG